MSDPVSRQIAYTELERSLGEIGVGADGEAVSRVRRLVLRSEGGIRSLEDVSSELGVSARTLKRRLAAAGVTYSDLLEDERREMAFLLLRSAEASLDAIAERLGYSDPSNFRRAFQRWTGVSPAAYRKGRNEEPEPCAGTNRTRAKTSSTGGAKARREGPAAAEPSVPCSTSCRGCSGAGSGASSSPGASSSTSARALLAGPAGLGVHNGSAPRAAGEAETPEVHFIAFVLDDVQASWQAQFAPRGAAYRHAKLVLYTDSTDTGCGYGEAATGPFYCPVDERVYIDLGFYRALTTKLGARGQFAQAYVVAHEIGHHVQKLLGISQRVDPMRNTKGATGASVRLELQADCFAGIWARSTQQRDLLQDGRHRLRPPRRRLRRRRPPPARRDRYGQPRILDPRLLRGARPLVQEGPRHRLHRGLRHLLRPGPLGGR